MAMEEALRAKLLGLAPLVALVGTRIDWGVRSEGKALPAIVLNEISGVPGMTFAGSDGWTSSRVQMDCWGRTMAAAKAVRDAALPALIGFRGTTAGMWLRIFITDRRASTDKDETGPVHRQSIDLRVWHRGAPA